MNDKLLVYIYVPNIGQKYNVFVPINIKVGALKKYVEKTVNELADNNLSNCGTLLIRNKINNSIYNADDFISNTDIKNGTKLVLL